MAQAWDQTLSPEVGVGCPAHVHQTGVTLMHTSYRERRATHVGENGFGRGDKVASFLTLARC
jgi:hypothetical protein